MKSSRKQLPAGIARGERAIREGRVFTEAQAANRLADWFKKR